jgi:hypothetical protein
MRKTPKELLFTRALSITYGSTVPYRFDPRIAGWLLLRSPFCRKGSGRLRRSRGADSLCGRSGGHMPGPAGPAVRPDGVAGGKGRQHFRTPPKPEAASRYKGWAIPPLSLLWVWKSEAIRLGLH